MKRILIFFAVLILAIGACAQNFDFSSVAPSGQTLYFKILSSSTAGVTYPQYGGNSYYSGYNKPKGNLIIPSTVTNAGTTYTITDITADAFRNCDSISSVTVPSSVSTIGTYAFYGCIRDSVLVLNNGVQLVDQYAFYNNPIKVLTIPRSIKSLGGHCFTSPVLHTVNYNADSCWHMGKEYSSSNYVFAECGQLKHVNFGEHVKIIPSYAFTNRPIDTLVLSDSIHTIYGSAFSGCGIDTIVWGNAIKAIGSSAFSGNTTLHLHTIPSTIREIGSYAFESNSIVTSFTVPSNVEYIGTQAFKEWTALTNVCFNADSCASPTYGNFFWGATHLTTITIGSNVKYIPSGAFTQLPITNIIIPSSVRTIGKYAFNGCTSLIAALIGDGVDTIGNSAFGYCSALSNVQFGNSVKIIDVYAFEKCTTLTSIVLPNSLTRIRGYAFSNCSQLSSITLSNNLKYIGENSFENCVSLANINMPNSIDTIRSNAFKGCANLQAITIPKNVKSLGYRICNGCSSLTTINYNADSCRIAGSDQNDNQTFYNCPSITNIVIGDNVKYIAQNIFMGLNNVQSVVIPDSVRTIGARAFSNMAGLTSVIFGNRVKWIGAAAFSNCSGLTTLTLPSSLQDIGQNAFYAVDNLTTIYSNAEIPPTTHYSNAFPNYVKNIPFYVKCNALYDYQNTSYWNTFTNYQLLSGSHSIHISSANEENGTAVYLTNNCETGVATIQAIPANHFRFAGWSDGIMDNPRTVTLTRDTVLTASFVEDFVTVEASSSNPSLGVVTGAGVYHRGDMVVLTAFPAPGQLFRGWSDNSEANPYAVTLMYDTTLVAFFSIADTVIMHDTTMIYDTIIVDNYIHDTTTVTEYVFDTTYIDNYIHDTTIVDNFIYDTTFIDNYIHDTTYIDNYIHDTTFVDNYIHDTMTVLLYDTVYVTEYDTVSITLHDTVSITLYDTVNITLHDTVSVVEPLTYFTVSVSSANISQGLAAGNGTFPDGTTIEIAAIPLEGFRFTQWDDGNSDNPRTLTVDGDLSFTASFETSEVAINIAEGELFEIKTSQNMITVTGASGERIRLFDTLGRQLAVSERAADIQTFATPATGTYYVQIGNRPARKVVVVR